MKFLITKQAQRQLNRLPDQPARTLINHLLFLKKNLHPYANHTIPGGNICYMQPYEHRALYSINPATNTITILRIG